MISAPAANHAYSPLEIRPPDLSQSDSSSWSEMGCEPMTCITCFMADMLQYAVSNGIVHDAHATVCGYPSQRERFLQTETKNVLSHTLRTPNTHQWCRVLTMPLDDFTGSPCFSRNAFNYFFPNRNDIQRSNIPLSDNRLWSMDSVGAAVLLAVHDSRPFPLPST